MLLITYCFLVFKANYRARKERGQAKWRILFGTPKKKLSYKLVESNFGKI